MIAHLRDTTDEALVQQWLVQLWNVPGVEVALNETGLWVRVADPKDASDSMLLKLLPGAERFETFQENLLCAIGSSVPSQRLTVVQWHRVKELAILILPAMKSVGSSTGLQPTLAEEHLRWDVTEAIEEASGILCEWNDWQRYALCAPLAKLSHLRFAANPSGMALVIGCPAPPIKGIRLLEYSRILLPSPYSWLPKVPASSIREKLGVAQDVWLLWTKQEELQTIADSLFIGASRTTIRATQQALLAETTRTVKNS